MKILFIASAGSIHSIRWINYFVNKKNTKITWITLSNPNNSTINEFEKINKKIKVYKCQNFINFFSIIIKLLTLNFDLIHIHYLGWNSLFSLFCKQRSKLILTPWGSDLLSKNFLKSIWFNLLFKKSDFVICDSIRLANEAIKFGMSRKKILISMFGVDTDIYKKSRSIFSKKQSYTIGSNRNLEEIYDVKTFIRAANIVCKKRNDVYFFIAGDGSLKSKYIEYVKDHDLSDKVKFFGILNKDQMIDFYNNLDIYVSTSLSDGGLAASIAEAMSFERLIIVSNNSDNSEWIKNGVNGYLFDSKDHKKLSEIIFKSIDNKDKSIKIANSSRNLITEKYSYENEMSKVENTYSKIINS